MVLLPARFTAAEEREWVRVMLARLEARERRAAPSNEGLHARAAGLARRYVPEAPAPASVRWVGNQHGRWGSCSVADRTIRISDRLVGLPSWVLDYVIVHELAHLVVASHGRDFWELVERYPRAERARGFLEGVAAAGAAEGADAD